MDYIIVEKRKESNSTKNDNFIVKLWFYVPSAQNSLSMHAMVLLYSLNSNYHVKQPISIQLLSHFKVQLF